jgi:hypothetical protein
MYKRILAAAALALTAAVALGATGAFGKNGGRLELYLVNSGPNTRFYTFSGDGTCPDQGGDQFFFWRVDCAGPTCGAVSLTGGYQQLSVPAGTPINTLFNLHVGVSSPISVGAGDTITLSLRSPLYYLPIQWSAAKGPGVSYLSILTG